jgi:hypothetical protein
MRALIRSVPRQDRSTLPHALSMCSGAALSPVSFLPPSMAAVALRPHQSVGSGGVARIWRRTGAGAEIERERERERERK